MFNANLEDKDIFLHVLILFLNLRGHYFASCLVQQHFHFSLMLLCSTLQEIGRALGTLTLDCIS